MATEPGDVAVLMTFSAAIGGAATWLANFFFKLRAERRKEHVEDDTTAVGRYREMHDRLLAQIDRYEALIREQEGLKMQLIRERENCRVRLADHRGRMVQMRDIMIHAGLSNVPELPPRVEDYDDGIEFQARQTAQDSTTLHTVAQRLKSDSGRVLTSNPQPPPGSNP